ncbi:putative hemicentin-2 [Sesbania bispinosa]|nr:putative hemicentin-2 [Sesbania bispinosa]
MELVFKEVDGLGRLQQLMELAFCHLQQLIKLAIKKVGGLGCVCTGWPGRVMVADSRTGTMLHWLGRVMVAGSHRRLHGVGCVCTMLGWLGRVCTLLLWRQGKE